MKFTVSTIIGAEAGTIYKAWLNGSEHSAMTGARATGSGRLKGKFTAWDGYISGINLKLRPAKLIVQAWRTTEFAEGQEHSVLTIELRPLGKSKTKVVLTHSNLKKGDLHYKQGWKTHYFAPMKEYFR